MEIPITRSVFNRYKERVKRLDRENQEIFIREFFESARSIIRLRAWMMFFVVFGIATIVVTSISNYNIYAAQLGLFYSVFLIILLFLQNYVSKKYLRNEIESLMDFLEWKNKKSKKPKN